MATLMKMFFPAGSFASVLPPPKKSAILINLCEPEVPPLKKRAAAAPRKKTAYKKSRAAFPCYQDWNPRVPYGWESNGKPRAGPPKFPLCAFDPDRDIF